MPTTTARPKKTTSKSATVRSKARSKPAKSWLVGLFARKYGKPATIVLIFAVVGSLAAWWAAAATTTYSLWSDSTIPKTITASDNQSVELGVHFHAKVAGYITGIRFYKGAQNTGTHVGTLWDASGNILAQATFTNETSTGWQSVTFKNPVNIAANTTYTASYFAPKGHYSANNFYFQKTTRSHNNLVASKSTSSAPNGVYLYNSRGGFPTQTYQATNYWVDVMFNSKLIAPQPAPSAPASLSSTTVSTKITLTWQASTGANSITSYNIFRDGNKIGTSATTSFTDSNAVAGKTYSYQVQAIDSTGTTSALSAALAVTLPATTPPTPPTPIPPTPPTPPVTQPQAGNFPTASNTGASACSSLTQVKGDVILGNANEVYQNVCLKGTLAITACNVTIKNVEVDTGEPVSSSSNDLFAIWAQEAENCPLTISNVSVVANDAPNNFVTTAIRIARGGVVNISNSKLVGIQLGVIGYGAGTMQGNYMELGANPNLDWIHNEDVEISGSNGVVMNGNTFLDQNDQTSALSIFTEYGANTNLTVSNNLVAGGIYTVYAGGGLCSNSSPPVPTPEANAKFINNVFWKKYFPNVGSAGEARDYSPAGGGIWSGNVYMNADGTLTTQQVPQAPPDTQDKGKC